MSPERKVTLKGWDHAEKFEVDEDVAQESQFLKDLIEAVGVESPISLPNVSREILKKVIEFCTYHVEAVKKSKDNPVAVDDEMESWDKEFMKVDQATLFHLMNAANYLNIKKLLDLTCQTLANMIKDKSPEEMRHKIFNIKDDLTPEEKEALKRDYLWAFE